MKSFLKSFSKKMSDKAVQTYTEATVFPVLTAPQLVPASDQKSYLSKLNEIIQLPIDHFEALYADLLTNFIEFAQILPSTYGGKLGGLIFESMHRGHMAVQLLHDTSDTKPDPLYTYAVFSMPLLMDVNCVMSTQKIMMCDDHGTYQQDWCPFNGSMLGQGNDYQIREYFGHRETFLNSINPILAQSLLPEVARGWLCSDTDIFDMWIAVLTGHEEWAGSLGKFLKLLKKLLAELGLGEELDTRLVDVEGWEPEDHADAEAFWKWLKDGIESGEISVNEKDSHVHVTEEGVFCEEVDEMYSAFNHTYSAFRDFILVQKKANYLGLTQLSGEHYNFKKYFATRSDTASRLGLLSHQQKDKAGSSNSMLVKDKGLLLKNPSKHGLSKHVKGSSIQMKQSAQLPKLAGSISASVKLKKS